MTNSNLKSKFFIFVLLLSAIYIPLISQAVAETGVGSNLTATINPTDPGPGEQVSITLSGYGFNMDQSYFSWTKDGQGVASGYGMKKFSFQLAQLGSATRVGVSVYYGNRHLADKLFYFEPSSLNLSWQAESETPPLYQGKARASAGSTIKIVATPYIVDQQGQVEKALQLAYNWRRDGTPLNNDSGIGKNVLLINTSPSDHQIKISLKITSPKSGNAASKDLILNLVQPTIAFYEKKPLEGVNYGRQVIGSYDLYGEEASFQAIPLFWPLNYLPQLAYSWRINNLPATTDAANPDILTVRQSATSAGRSEIAAQLLNKGEDQVSIGSRFNINFGNNLLKLNNAN